MVGQLCLRNSVLWDPLLLQSERITSVAFALHTVL